MRTKEELLKQVKPLLQSEGWQAFIELIKLKQSEQVRRAMSVVEAHEIYRAQGKVWAYDSVLTLEQEIKVA